MITEETKDLFTKIVHTLMRSVSYGIKGGEFSCKLNHSIYCCTLEHNEEHRDGLLELADSLSIKDYGYKVLNIMISLKSSIIRNNK
jgi:hypothetical protein